MDKQEMCMTIYSGEFLPTFFTWQGTKIRELSLRLCDRQDFDYNVNEFYFNDLGNHKYILFMPRILEINIKANRSELDAAVETLGRYCSSIQRNIATKINHEYIYELMDGPRPIHIQAGPGSYKYFRDNFLRRLAEVFYNLEWINTNLKTEFDIEEFKIYENLLDQLKVKGYSIPDYLTQRYESLKKVL